MLLRGQEMLAAGTHEEGQNSRLDKNPYQTQSVCKDRCVPGSALTCHRDGRAGDIGCSLANAHTVTASAGFPWLEDRHFPSCLVPGSQGGHALAAGAACFLKPKQAINLEV